MTEVLPPGSDIDYAYVTPKVPAGGGLSTNFNRQSMADFAGNAAINMPSDADAIAATGSNQATAHVLIDVNNRITTGATGTGVKLPVGNPGQMVWITNSTTTTKFVYPAVGGQINGGVVNAKITLAPNAQIACLQHTTTGWEVRGFSETNVNYETHFSGGIDVAYTFPADAFISGMHVVRYTATAANSGFTFNLPSVATLFAQVHALTPAHTVLLRVINSMALAASNTITVSSADNNWTLDTTGSVTGAILMADGVTNGLNGGGASNFLQIPAGYYKDIIVALTGPTTGKVYVIGAGVYDIDGVAGQAISTIGTRQLSGLSNPQSIDLTSAKATATGLNVGASASGAVMGLTAALTGTIKLVTTAANSTTITQGFSIIYRLPQEYVPGAPLTVKVDAGYVLGSGVIGTHTLTMSALGYQPNQTGTGANTSALSVSGSTVLGLLSGSVPENTFTITGNASIIKPGTLLIVTFVVVVQDTGGSNVTAEVRTMSIS